MAIRRGFMLKDSMVNIFDGITDHRSTRNQKPPFTSLLGISLLGAISGIDSFSGLGDYAEMHFEGLSQHFDLPHGPPSHDTFQRLFDAIEPEQLHDSFFQFTQQLSTIFEGIIAIDGKTIRNSGNNPLHIVNAWCESNQLVLAQMCVDKKSNEITAIPLLLKLLDLHDRVVTIDAMGCQRKIASQIIEQKGDYLLNLKGNQGSLHEDVKFCFTDQVKQTSLSWEEFNKGHGRLEHRKCYATDDIAWINSHHKWPGLKSIAMVESKRIIKDKVETETRYYISSLEADPEKICKAARAHWGVENKCHWRLDVVFNEDKACITNDNAAENMSIIRKWALNILNKNRGKSSIKSLQRKACMSLEFAKSLIKTFLHA